MKLDSMSHLAPMAARINREVAKKAKSAVTDAKSFKEEYIKEGIIDFVKSGAVYLMQAKRMPSNAYNPKEVKIEGFVKLMINFKDFHPTCAGCKYWGFGMKCKKNDGLTVEHKDYCGKHSDLEQELELKEE